MRSAPPQGWPAASRASVGRRCSWGSRRTRCSRCAAARLRPSGSSSPSLATPTAGRWLGAAPRRSPTPGLLPAIARRRGRDGTPCGVGRRAATDASYAARPHAAAGSSAWPASGCPIAICGALRRYRYGPGVFKLDWALDGPVPWTAEPCRRAGTLHIGGTAAEIVESEDAVWRGEAPGAAVHDRRATEPLRRDPGAAGKAHRSGRTATSRMARPWT